MSVETYQLSLPMLFWFICAFRPDTSSFSQYSYFCDMFKLFVIYVNRMYVLCW